VNKGLKRIWRHHLRYFPASVSVFWGKLWETCHYSQLLGRGIVLVCPEWKAGVWPSWLQYFWNTVFHWINLEVKKFPSFVWVSCYLKQKSLSYWKKNSLYNASDDQETTAFLLYTLNS